MRVGSWVRLRREQLTNPGHFRKSTQIERILTSIPGGVMLDKPLDGLRYWNVDALERGNKKGPNTKK